MANEKNKETGDRLELLGTQFTGLINDRNYRDARTLYHSLNDDDKEFISSHPEYRWYIKKLRFSCV